MLKICVSGVQFSEVAKTNSLCYKELVVSYLLLSSIIRATDEYRAEKVIL